MIFPILNFLRPNDKLILLSSLTFKILIVIYGYLRFTHFFIKGSQLQFVSLIFLVLSLEVNRSIFLTASGLNLCYND